MRLFYLLFLLMAPGLSLYAQNSPGLRNVIVDSSSYVPVDKYRALGVSYTTTRDEALSPLVFQGPGVTFSASSWKYNRNWLLQPAFTGRLHLLKNASGSSVYNEAAFKYQYTALRELLSLQHGNWRFWAGPEAGMLLNMRLHSRNTNNIASYDWAGFLGASAMVSNRFSLWGRTFAVSNQLHIPLFFLYARPPFAWAVPPAIFEEAEGAWKEVFQVGTLNNIMSLSNQVNLDFYLRKRKKGKLVQYRAFRLTYNWNYFAVGTGNPLKTGGHALSFSRVITF